MNILLLLDYKVYYGLDKSYLDAEELIKDIPSVTLLNYISGFNVNLYLNENTERSGKIQFMLVNSLLSKCGVEAQNKWTASVKLQADNGHAPMLFWNYSNLLFYGLIFKTINNLAPRDLTNEEAQKAFDAYLIINSIANNKIQIESSEFQKAEEANKIEEVVMPMFMYQKDYASTTDFSNQVTRGVKFFQYLENHTKYGPMVKEFYNAKHISGHLKMFKNLMVLFSLVNIGKDSDLRNQLANLQEYVISGDIDLEYIETLCINSEVANYEADHSFGLLRNKFLYKLSQFKFLILDINFLIDQFYKTQIFSFYSFLKMKGIKGDFLADKGKNFTEMIYLPDILKACFPDYVTFFGDDCTNSAGEELCDAYLRDNNKICLIEFKDVLLNAGVKNSADKEILFAEFDKKFVANQTNKPKGITQLINAIKDIAKTGVLFDIEIPNLGIEIYPVVMYTDLSFGADGMNKIFKEKFREEISKLDLKNLIVKDVTFINLNFFEIREDYLTQKLMNLFIMIDAYHEHTAKSEYRLTPFEVFSKFYMQNNVPEDLPLPSRYQNILSEIVGAR